MEQDFKTIIRLLSKIAEAVTNKPDEDEFIDLDELCKIFGIAKRTYYQNKSKYELREYRFGRKLRFNRHEAIDSMNKKIQKSA